VYAQNVDGATPLILATLNSMQVLVSWTMITLLCVILVLQPTPRCCDSPNVGLLSARYAQFSDEQWVRCVRILLTYMPKVALLVEDEHSAARSNEFHSGDS